MIPLARCCVRNPRYRVWARGRTSRYPLQIELGAYDSKSASGAMQKAYRRGSWVPPGYKRVAVRENPVRLDYHDAGHNEDKTVFVDDEHEITVRPFSQNPLPMMTNPPITESQRDALYAARDCLALHGGSRGIDQAMRVADVVIKHEVEPGGITYVRKRKNPVVRRKSMFGEQVLNIVGRNDRLMHADLYGADGSRNRVEGLENLIVVDTVRRNPPITTQERQSLEWAADHVRDQYPVTGRDLFSILRRHDIDPNGVVDNLPRRYARNPELLMVGMAAMNPGGKIRLKDVKQAEREYASAMSAWGENNMVTRRAMAKWYDLRAAYAQQTGKSVNPKRRGSMRHRRIRIRVKHRRRNSRRRARGFTRRVKFHGKLLTGFQIQKKYGITAARRALGINPGRKHRRGRRRR